MNWISVKELPEQGIPVLCYQNDECVVAFWGEVEDWETKEIIDIYWVTEEHGCSLNTESFPITHWQHLPEPPND